MNVRLNMLPFNEGHVFGERASCLIERASCKGKARVARASEASKAHVYAVANDVTRPTSLN